MNPSHGVETTTEDKGEEMAAKAFLTQPVTIPNRERIPY